MIVLSRPKCQKSEVVERGDFVRHRPNSGHHARRSPGPNSKAPTAQNYHVNPLQSFI